MSDPKIKVFYHPNFTPQDVELFIPKSMLLDYLLGEENLVFSLSRDDAKQLSMQLRAQLGSAAEF